MIKWADIPTAAKMSATAVVAVMGILGYLTTYQSDVEAQAYQQAHNQQLALIRVQEIETQIRQYQYQLLSSQLTPAQRDWIINEIRRLEALIACIRVGTC